MSRGRNRIASLLVSTACVLVAQAARAQDEAGTTVLPTISVEGSSYETESTGSYASDLVSVGEKDVLPQREIPQSTTIVTRQRLDDGGFTSLDTALRKTPGMMVLTNDDGRSSLYSRGFEFDTLYFNGLPAPLSSIYGTQPDMAIVDHIEILRGPAGLFGGAGEPAGAINMRLKQASDQFMARITGTGGSWNSWRGEVDVGGPLNEAGTIRGRIVGALGQKDSFVDVVDNRAAVGYGTLQFDITENTTATVSVSHQKRDITPFNGLPTLADGTLLDLDRSTFTGAVWNDFNSAVTDYIAELEHRFDDGGHVKASARYSTRDVDFLYAYAANAASPALTVNGMRWLSRDYDENSLALDLHVSKPFEIGEMENNIILGADHRRVDSTLYNATGVITGTWHLLDWNTAVAKPTVTYGAATDTKLTQTGIYGQWRIKPVDRLTLIGGARVTWYATTSSTSEVSADGEWTPYAGVVYDLTDDVSAYASYTEIFQPQSALDAGGNLLDPRSGRQFEVGLKAELFDDVNATVAYFNLRDKNRAVSDPDNPGSSLALGEARMQGIELEVNGQINPNWQVAAGYTYTDTKFVNTRYAAGSEFYTPEHMFHLWTTYSFDENHGVLDGAFVGAGLRAYSSFKNISRTAAGGATTIEAPGYAVVDLQAGYKFNEHLTAVLSVNNVFDKKYYERVGGTSVFNFYGEPRSFNFKLTGTF